MEEIYREAKHDPLDTSTLLLMPTSSVRTQTFTHSNLRRSPRKHANAVLENRNLLVAETVSFRATSNQRRQSPSKKSPSKQSTVKRNQEGLEEAQMTKDIFSDLPLLRKAQTGDRLMPTADTQQRAASPRYASDLQMKHGDSWMLPLSKTALRTDELTGSDSEPSFILGSARPKQRHRSSSGKSVMSLMTEAARNAPLSVSPTRNGRLSTRNKKAAAAKMFVLGEAACTEDAADSDANNEGEVADEETDLSGFIVDDDAELSHHDSMESNNDEDEDDSEYERRTRKVRLRQKVEKQKPKRRLQRGRRKVVDSDEDDDNEAVGKDLTSAFDNMKINGHQSNREAQGTSKLDAIDLVSPDLKVMAKPRRTPTKGLGGMNLFDKLSALRLSPPRLEQDLSLPSKENESVPALTPPDTSDGQTDEDRTHQPTTPPKTPPRSPTKLKSPSKLLSPSKKGTVVQRSPHRQSVDAFWDLHVVNEWNDTYSPKKAPLNSPRKTLKYFDLWSDSDDNESVQKIEESSDGLPSPCESPTKMRVTTSPMKSPEKAAKQKAQQEKKVKLAKKKAFDASKDRLARELFDMLDRHVTGGAISEMAKSTGGVEIIWSKTLRSTAGRANWKKTRTSSSPAKNGIKTDETVRHFANIELAIKVIDRPERLYDTLAHEFCHLANFMISGVLKEPHGAQFQNWAKQTTAWLHNSSGRPEWEVIKITTKHGYVIEHKYLWVCMGRANLDGSKGIIGVGAGTEEGCGAEYGRHSKSIDTATHRCGVCKGLLIQVRPKPRSSPKKINASPAKNLTKAIDTKSIEQTVREIEIIELSD